MFSLISASLVSVNFGPSVTGIGHVGRAAFQQDKIQELDIQWQELQDTTQAFSLLSWHTRISEFTVRSTEMDELERWTASKLPVSVKFITGEGGMGKSRLAAEFAKSKKDSGWSAGFIDLRTSQSFPLKKEGTLLVIDYPEENRESVEHVLNSLAGLGSDKERGRLRVLFLTRQNMDNWQRFIHGTRATDIVDMAPIHLGNLETDKAYKLFGSTIKYIRKELEIEPPHLSEDEFSRWLEKDSVNRRPLFIIAAAVNSALEQNAKGLYTSGREVIEALVEREISRLRNAAKEVGVADYSLARLSAMATIADVMPVKRIKELAKNDGLELGLSKADNIESMLKGAGLLQEREVCAQKPDILAAAFTVNVLKENPDSAGEILWAALETDLKNGLERLARISHDTEIVLGMHEHRTSTWLAEALKDNYDRCKMAEFITVEEFIPTGWIEAAIVVCRTLLENPPDDDEKAYLLNNLSRWLGDKGDTDNAFIAINEAVKIHRKLAEDDPKRFEPDLAMSLNSLSNRLAQKGDIDKALDAIKEAVKIYRRLAEVERKRFEPNLALSLNNLSIRLAKKGDIDKALDSIKEAVKIYRRLAKAEPARFKPHLAMSLNSLSNRLAKKGDIDKALDSIKEAVKIYRRLAKAKPARFEPVFAISLGALGQKLGIRKLYQEAIDIFREGVDIIRPYAERYPGSPFERQLNNLETDLKRTEEEEGVWP